MRTVEFGLLPNFHNLFLDYVSPDAETKKKVKKFFNGDLGSPEDFQRISHDKTLTYNTSRYFDKNTLIDILKRQNVTFGGSEITAAQIELLNKENTFTVVTGQQVGLYTGNLYTIYKTVAAIKLANQLKQDNPTYNFVPVFWLESDDHDFEEMNHVHIINKNNELVRIGYEDGQLEEVEDEVIRRETKPVGSLKFDESIIELNQKLNDNLIKTDFTENLIQKINQFYREGNDYKTAFAQLMNWVFRDHGIVFIDPSDREIKKLLIPIFEKELNTTPVLCEKIIDVSADIEKNYDLQVKPKVINVFYLHNGNRQLIEPRGNEKYAVRNTKKRFEKDELIELMNSNPELFSSNVVLRPVCQDYLLPTIAYVGGPAEISYFAQFKPAYEHYELTMPLIFPRTSITIVEKKITKFLENFEIDFHDIFHHKILVSKVIDKISEIKVDDVIAKAIDEINGTFYNLKETTGKIDKTLTNTLEGMKGKLFQNLEIFKGKLTNALVKKSEVTTAQLDRVLNNIYPNKNLQERVINVLYYLNKYDDFFIKSLFEETDINNFNHQVIDI